MQTDRETDVMPVANKRNMHIGLYSVLHVAIKRFEHVKQLYSTVLEMFHGLAFIGR